MKILNLRFKRQDLITNQNGISSNKIAPSESIKWFLQQQQKLEDGVYSTILIKNKF